MHTRQSIPAWPGRTCGLYRCFDAEDRLLYVGISFKVWARWQQHSLRSPWFHEVRKVTIERFESRGHAADAEREAVAKEKPVHNERLRERGDGGATWVR